MKLGRHKLRWEHLTLYLSAIAALVAFCASALGYGVATIGLALYLGLLILLLGSLTGVFSSGSLRLRLTCCVLPVVTVIFMISVAVNDWPLHISYKVSRPALDRLAHRVQAGEHVRAPVQAGLFRVRKTEISAAGVVCLWTFPHAGGNTGFVQCPPDNVPFNLFTITRLDHRWQLISED